MVKGENWIEQKGIERLRANPLPNQRTKQTQKLN
jgi:hypothetical protein